ACTSNENDNSKNSKKLNDKEESNLIEIKELFDDNEFDNPKKSELLKELKICSDNNNSTVDYMHPSCSPRFFELFQISEKLVLEDAFILLTKSKVYGFPLRRIAVFIREKGRLVKTNEYIGNIIGMKKNSSKFHDILLRFIDKEQGENVFFNCYFTWVDGVYKYKSVEVIEGANWGGAVKAELKDSISIEVEKDIIKNGMILQ
ncbi:MAG: hypothetical protein HYR91_11795, partial [Flavobacteriia bacterium]|nr:hypothetical protein [Flavobacteriia bacterium]